MLTNDSEMADMLMHQSYEALLFSKRLLRLHTGDILWSIYFEDRALPITDRWDERQAFNKTSFVQPVPITETVSKLQYSFSLLQSLTDFNKLTRFPSMLSTLYLTVVKATEEPVQINGRN